MANPSPTRQAILSRIRGPHAKTTPELAAEEYAEIPRNYLRAATLTRLDMFQMFQDRLESEYSSHRAIHRVSPDRFELERTSILQEQL